MPRTPLCKLQSCYFAILALAAFTIPARAVNLNFINLPGNVTIEFDAAWGQGSGPRPIGPGDLAFFGKYPSARFTPNVSAMAYIVNPGTNIVAAQISIALGSDGPTVFVNGTFLAAPAAGSLGTLPPGFTGVPADPNKLVDVLGSFQDVQTHAPVFFPANMTIFVQSQLGPAPPVITSSPTLPAADLCVSSASVTCGLYSFNFQASGTVPITWSILVSFTHFVPQPPPNLTLDQNTGILSGLISPQTSPGTFPFEVDASNTIGTNGQQTSILVNNQPSITTTTLQAFQGLAYSATLAATGGTPPYNWAAPQAGSKTFPASFVPFTSVVSVTGPAANGDQVVLGNSTLSAATVIEGLPLPSLPGEVFTDTSIQLAAGQSFANVYVPTAAERTGDFSAFPVPIIDPLTNQSFPNNQIPVSRLFGLYAFRVASTRLPAGFTLGSNGLLSNNLPTVAGVFNIPVQATDSAGGPTSVAAVIPLLVIPELIITSGAPPDAEVGIQYSFTFTGSGGSGPRGHTWGIVAGSAPANLAFTGPTLTGVPNAPGLANFTVRLADFVFPSLPPALQNVKMNVVPRLTITSGSTLPAADVCAASATVSCTPYSFTFASSGGRAPIAWSLFSGTPPSGFRLNPTTGVLSGITTGPTGTPFFLVSATDPLRGIAFQQPALTVNAQPAINANPLTAYQGVPFSATLSATGGTPPFSWTATQAGSKAFPGGFVPFTSVLSTSGAAPNGDRIVLGTTSTPASSIVARLPLPSLSGEVFTDTSIQLAPGQSFVNVYVPTAAERTGDFSAFPVPIINPVNGQAFPNNVIPANSLSGLYAFRVAANRLPGGLTLSSRGVLSASAGPAVPGAFNITVQATDSAGGNESGATTVAATLPLLVVPALAPIRTPLPTAEVNVPYTFTFRASGGVPSYTWSVSSSGGTIPPNLNLSVGGILSGIPKAVGTYPFQVTVTDLTPRPGPQAASEPLSLQVVPQVAIATASPLPPGQVGIFYSAQLQTTPGTGVPQFTWSVPRGSSLPPGLKLTSKGAITGTFNSSNGISTFSFSVQVNDALGGTAVKSFQLTMIAHAPSITVAVPEGITANTQPAVQVSPASTYATDISGTLTLAFNSAVGADDRKVRFLANNAKTLTFTIPANSTTVNFEGNLSQFVAGTTAGTITVTTTLQSLGRPITPVPAVQSIVIAPAVPELVGTMTAIRSANGGLTVTVMGFCTARQVTTAKFAFFGKKNLRTRAVVLDQTALFNTWYQNPTSIDTGTQFTYTAPFTVQGDPTDVSSVTLVLTGPQGDSQPMTAQIR